MSETNSPDTCDENSARRLYLTYDERDTYDEREDMESSDKDIEWTLTGCYRHRKRWLVESVDIDFDANPGQTVYVVYVRYGAGSTFGHTSGAWEIIGIYEHEDEARSVVKSIEYDTYSGYKCWEGYFESLERADYESMVVK